MNASGALIVEGLTVRAPGRGTLLVDGLSFALEPGRSLALLGESGSGKTLVVQAVMGTLASDLVVEGSIRLDGRELLGLDPRSRRALWGRRMALLPQEPWLALDPTMRALPQVAEMHALVGGRSWRNARDRAQRDLAALELGRAEQQRFPHQLSGGMCQRAALAAARAAGAPLLLADEPTKGLDATLRDAVARHLREEAVQGRALLVITHDVAVAHLLDGEAAIMLDGRIVEQGAVAEVLGRPRHDYTRALVAAAPANWPVRPGAAAARAPIVRAHGLVKRFGTSTVLSGIDLALGRGETLAVLGSSGCGKSTLGNLLLGLLQPDGGTVWRDPALSPLRFQKLYQEPAAAFPPFQVLGRGLADLAQRHQLKSGLLEGLLRRLRIPSPLLERRPDQVSGGELQRLALARVLALAPVFLFADEPTSRLDPVTQQDVMDCLRAEAATHDTALLLVTHDPDLAEKSADRLLRLGSADTELTRA